MSDFGLAMLFDRSGGKLTEQMRDLLAKHQVQVPFGNALIAQIREKWDDLDSREEEQKVIGHFSSIDLFENSRTWNILYS